MHLNKISSGIRFVKSYSWPDIDGNLIIIISDSQSSNMAPPNTFGAWERDPHYPEVSAEVLHLFSLFFFLSSEVSGFGEDPFRSE